MLKKTGFILICSSLLWMQQFDPTTGLRVVKDSTQVRFNPETGLPINQIQLDGKRYEGLSEPSKKPSDLSIFEIESLARRDVEAHYNTGVLWGAFGGGASLMSILFFVPIGGEMFEEIGGLVGLFTSILGVPVLLSNIESHPPYATSRLVSLSSEQKKVYLEAYKKTLKKRRQQSMYFGELGYVAGMVGLIILSF